MNMDNCYKAAEGPWLGIRMALGLFEPLFRTFISIKYYFYIHRM